MEQIHHCLTGMKFSQRVELWSRNSMICSRIWKEQRFTRRNWANSEAQIGSVLDSTVGIIGDFQGIAGKAIPDIANI